LKVTNINLEDGFVKTKQKTELEYIKLNDYINIFTQTFYFYMYYLQIAFKEIIWSN